MKYLTIPVEWFALDLTSTEIFILSEIVNLTNYHGKCTAHNKHFADILQMARPNISRCINSLKEKGYIEVDIIDGSRNHEREISVINLIPTPYQNDTEGLSKRLETKEINTIINNILSFLNGLVEKSYRATDKTKGLIKSRIKEGFTEEDFKYVVTVKAKEWKNNETMSKYLRPETLFGTKFEGYLNQEKTKDTGDWSSYAR